MIRLRLTEEADLDLFYEHQAEPEWAAMAAFESRDRATFFAHQRRVQSDPNNINRTVEIDGQVCGSVVSWLDEGRRFVGYGYGRDFWGRGIASEALLIYVEEVVPERPLYAYVAASNVSSQRVLEKAGFQQIHRHASQDDGIEERVYRLD